jgi:hypothetical protein
LVQNLQPLLPQAAVVLPLVGNITCWYGDIDALESAFVLQKALKGFIFTAIPEDQQKMSKCGRSKVQDAIDEKDLEMVTNDKLTVDD